jgi:hypothetical protein
VGKETCRSSPGKGTLLFLSLSLSFNHVYNLSWFLSTVTGNWSICNHHSNIFTVQVITVSEVCQMMGVVYLLSFGNSIISHTCYLEREVIWTNRAAEKTVLLFMLVVNVLEV